MNYLMDLIYPAPPSQLTFSLGSVIVIAACAWFYLQEQQHHQYTYGAAALIGTRYCLYFIIILACHFKVTYYIYYGQCNVRYITMVTVTYTVTMVT